MVLLPHKSRNRRKFSIICFRWLSALTGSVVGSMIATFTMIGTIDELRTIETIDSHSFFHSPRLDFGAKTMKRNLLLEVVTPDTQTETISKEVIKASDTEGREVVKRFHQVSHYRLKTNRPYFETAYKEATVILKETSWFKPPKKVCMKECCAERVAISLNQDDTRLVTNADGSDFADVLFHGNPKLPLKFHATYLSEDIIPCLQPGTIIDIDSYQDPWAGTTIKKFFKQYHPNITVPYVVVTTANDELSPEDPYFTDSVKDDESKMTHWYGDNPRLVHDKFTPLHIGLSKLHPQVIYLRRYLRHTNFQNPFANKSFWLESKELFSENTVDTTNLMFVKFKVDKVRKDRQDWYNLACNQGRKNGTIPIDNLSCSSNAHFQPLEIYAAASQYPFGLSPPGIGNDCYRTYELLFLGVIPIVQKNPMYDMEYFQALPIIQLDNPNDYTPKDLLKTMRNYVTSDKFLKNTFDEGWNHLFLRYWRRKILKDTGRDKDIIKDNDGNEYYQAWQYSSKNQQPVKNRRGK